MSILDNLPVATILSLAAIVTGVVLVVTNQIPINTTEDFLKFFGGLGGLVGGAGVLGIARNGSGRGVK